MYELTIDIHAEGKSYLYEQIYEHIKDEIMKGKLLANEKLPSTRSLAGHLQIARSTVEYAYGQLLDEGYIEARPCKGYFVKDIEEWTVQPSGAGRTGGYAEECGTKEEKSGESAEERPEHKAEYDFSPYDIDMSCFPYSVWKRITKEVVTKENGQVFSKGEPQGDLRLRQTICTYLYHARGVNCTPEQIVVGAGNDYLLMLLEKILGRNETIAMENPTYIRPCHIFGSFGYPVVPVDMDESGIRMEDLRGSGANLLYVMPAHQFPTGNVMPIGRRRELLRWASEEENRYIIEDDYDSEFRYHGKPIPALMASDEKGRIIYIGSFSKTIAPAIRISFMVLPTELAEEYRRKCTMYSCTVSRIDQSILDVFIREGYFERHLRKMRKLYGDKHEILLNGLEEFRGKFRILGENAGLHLVLYCRDERTETELVQRAQDVGVKVYGMSSCMAEKEKQDSCAAVLLGFGGMSEQEITDGLKCLKEAWL